MDHSQIVKNAVLRNHVTLPILNRWTCIALPECWLVAGAVVQAVWNEKFGFAPDHGMRDVDIVYHDPRDLSEESEAAHDARIGSMFTDLPVRLDVKNEARVHLWYEARFGYAIAPYGSAKAAIATFPTTATAIGVRRTGQGWEIEAPFGLADLCDGVVRPNRVQVTQKIYEAKVARWRALWPDLIIHDW